MKQKESPRKKSFNIAVPIVLFIIVLVIAVGGSAISWQMTVARMQQNLSGQIIHQVENFHAQMENQIQVLKGVATSVNTKALQNVSLIRDQLERSARQTNFESVALAYPNGLIYRHDGVQTDVSDRSYFIEGMKGNSSIQYLRDSRMDDSAKLLIAVPLIIDDKVEGVVAGTYEDAAFRQMFENSLSSISALSYICESDGRYIMGTEDASEIMEMYEPGITVNGGFFDILAKSEFSQSTMEEIVDHMAAGEGGRATYVYYGDRRYTTYEPLGINDWYVVAVLPETQVYDQAMDNARISNQLLALAMAVIFFIVVYIVVKEYKQVLKEKQRADEIRYNLEHDDLTGLLREKIFQTQVQERLSEIESDQYCIAYMDIYKFKLINEMFGYEKGDELLCAIAKEIQEMADEHDGICGRISGDKFVIFVPHIEVVLSQFRSGKRRYREIIPIDIYLHHGIYVITDTDIPIAQMIDGALIAQKAIKGNYDNYISYYDQKLKDKIVKEQEIISCMSDALENGEFIVYLQPQYNYRDGSISGAEALVRWKRPEKGLVSPGDFIPVFESNGFIIRLDENVWEQVCKMLRKWIDEGRKPMPISVNVSRADLLKGKVADKLMGLVEKYGLTPDLLRVEITESAYMDNPQKLISEINSLADCGFIVEMDDFGSGYSSLNMLKEIPLNVLKTDLKFLTGAGIAGRKEHILDSVIKMAHQMGMSIIAEGVETKEQADRLLQLDCECMQGFHFSRPIPVQEFEDLIYGEEKAV